MAKKGIRTSKTTSLRCQVCGRTFRTTGDKKEVESIKATIRCLGCGQVGKYTIIASY